MKAPGEFDGETILQLRNNHEKAFDGERAFWLQNIISENKKITEPQKIHLENQNKRLNLAIRLIEPFPKDANFWSLPPEKQVVEIVGAVQRMKPLIDFFVR